MAAPSVCVVIAARNASATITRAVRSALRETEVAEVVVVDDGSSDATSDAARSADDGSRRLSLLSLPRNHGPAFARNHAIAHSSAPYIAVLDADDFFLKGRFKRMLSADDWDFVADNIVFIDQRAGTLDPDVPDFPQEPCFLDIEAFVEGNISQRGASRGEIGFLKPIMRRAFLNRHGLRYADEMRLGEDYDLYARALLRGARYKIVHDCGYGAVVRPDSLSGRHRTEDLRRLHQADLAMLSASGLTPSARKVIGRHARHILGRYQLRNFLDIKASSGLWSATRHALADPASAPAIVGGIAADKLDAMKARWRKAPEQPAALRYLLPVQK